MRKFFAKIIDTPRLTCAVAICAASLAAPAFGAEKSLYELHQSEHLSFDAQGLMTEEYRQETLINSEAVVQSLGLVRISNDDHFHDLVIVEAATLKADGRRIDVAPERIFKMSGKVDGKSLFDANSTVRIVPFPDLAVGDRRILRVLRRDKTRQIPGAIFVQVLFSPTEVGASEDFSIDQPDALHPHVASEDFSVDLPDVLHLHVADADLTHADVAIPGGRRMIWHVELPPARTTTEPLAVASIDRLPHIFISNSANWHEFGRIYGAALAPAGKPDDTIIAQADAITEGLVERRDIARALFDWTASNIRYFNVILGSGGVFPHAPRTILNLRYGDCKDHAALLQALLAAKGIDSQLVLINQARIYADYPLPVPFFDHMIVHVPEFDLYLDPTDPRSSFDFLSPDLRDKPVVRFTATDGIAARTPLNKVEDASVTLTSAITIGEDGYATGTSTVEGRGPLAEPLRASAHQIATQGAAEVARATLAAQELRGSGGFEAPSFLDKSDPYRITSTFRFDNPLVSADARFTYLPTGPRLFDRPVESLARGTSKNWVDAFECGIPQTYVERVTIAWPTEVKLRWVPKNVDVTAGIASYRATYTQVGDGLAVERVFRFSPPHAVCQISELKAAAAALNAAQQDFNMILFLEIAPKT